MGRPACQSKGAHAEGPFRDRPLALWEPDEACPAIEFLGVKEIRGSSNSYAVVRPLARRADFPRQV